MLCWLRFRLYWWPVENEWCTVPTGNQSFSEHLRKLAIGFKVLKEGEHCRKKWIQNVTCLQKMSWGSLHTFEKVVPKLVIQEARVIDEEEASGKAPLTRMKKGTGLHRCYNCGRHGQMAYELLQQENLLSCSAERTWFQFVARRVTLPWNGKEKQSNEKNTVMQSPW